MENLNYVIVLGYLNLKTSANHTEELEVKATTRFVNLVDDKLVVDWTHPVWVGLSKYLDNIHEGLSVKALRAIRRRIKGTSKGIQITYRDEDNLVQHLVINIIEEVKL